MPYIVEHDNNRYERSLHYSLAMLSPYFALSSTYSVRGSPDINMTRDSWIKCTMNKGSLVKSGWPSFLQHEKQLLEQCSQDLGRSCQPKTSKDKACKMPTDADARRWAVHTGPSCVITRVWLIPVWPSITHYPHITVSHICNITDFNSVLASEETILIPSCDSGSSVTLPRSMSQYLWPNAWRLTKGKNDQTTMHYQWRWNRMQSM